MTTTYVAVCPETGRHLRPATTQEQIAYLAQPARHPAFRCAIRVGDVLVDEDNGPGSDHTTNVWD